MLCNTILYSRRYDEHGGAKTQEGTQPPPRNLPKSTSGPIFPRAMFSGVPPLRSLLMCLLGLSKRAALAKLANFLGVSSLIMVLMIAAGQGVSRFASALQVTSAMLTLRKHSTSSSPHSAANPVSASSTTHRATREAAPTASPKHMTTVATAPAPSRTTSTAPQNRSTSTTTGTPDPFSVQPSAAEAAPASSTTQRATRETTPTLAPKQLTTAAAAPVERPTTTTSTTQPASQSATKRSVAGVV